jgi:hypothetical protein
VGAISIVSLEIHFTTKDTKSTKSGRWKIEDRGSRIEDGRSQHGHPPSSILYPLLFVTFASFVVGTLIFNP